MLGLLSCVLPVKSIFSSISGWVDGHHVWGAILLPLLFCIAIPLAIPSTLLEVLGGSAFGIAGGTLLNVFGKTLGSLVAFAIGKQLGRQRLRPYLFGNFSFFAALLSVVESPSWKPLILIQLSSLPPMVKSYGLSVTDISVMRFTASALIGGTPSAILWAYIGFQAKDIMTQPDKPSAGAARWITLALGLCFTVLAMACLFVYTRRELQAQLLTAKKTSSTDLTSDASSALEDGWAVVRPLSLAETQQIAKRTSFS
ncbi:hypothetical protein PINS_up000397 [Pythium insidiosum]|nr:hypothetical protein PINS_up000397 [Pythium insidiosum]